MQVHSKQWKFLTSKSGIFRVHSDGYIEIIIKIQNSKDLEKICAELIGKIQNIHDLNTERKNFKDRKQLRFNQKGIGNKKNNGLSSKKGKVKELSSIPVLKRNKGGRNRPQDDIAAG